MDHTSLPPHRIKECVEEQYKEIIVKQVQASEKFWVYTSTNL